MSVSQVYSDTAALAAGGQFVNNNLTIKGSQSSICLLFAGKATSAVAGQPATQTLTFVVPGSVATDLVFYSKESSATPASVITTCALSNAGLINATYTLTLSANEVLTADLCVYRAV
jgi:hypothetical protein